MQTTDEKLTERDIHEIERDVLDCLNGEPHFAECRQNIITCFAMARAAARQSGQPASRQLLNITKGALDHAEDECRGLLLALEHAADFIHSHHADPNTETGWDTDEACDAWLKCRAAISCAKSNG